jgi:antibiotic biosynthesis monooxygenase (ABM) superfamily enzyme
VPHIEAKTNVVTQINVFDVEPENQQAMIDLLIESAEFCRDIPGWISASIHRSPDGCRVVNYAQSESMETAQHIIDRLREKGYLERNKRLGVAHPGLYSVVATVEK